MLHRVIRKFNRSIQSERNALLRDDESADLSIAPTSPYLDMDHHHTAGSSTQSDLAASHHASFYSPSPAADDRVSLNTQASAAFRPSAHSAVSEMDNNSDYDEDDTPQDFVERRLGHSSLPLDDHYPFYLPEVPASSRESPASLRESPASVNDDEILPRCSEPRREPKQNTWADEFFYWGAMLVSMLTVISSTAWLCLALGVQDWQGIIHSGDRSLTTITTTISMISKANEVASIGVYILVLGQMLSLSAMHGEGIDLSVLNVKAMILRPGLLLTHSPAIKHGFMTWPLVSLLAGLTMISTLAYTSASNSLVNPRLINTPAENQYVFGLVNSSFANPAYIEQTCQSPITQAIDPVSFAFTCLGTELVGGSYYNYLGYTEGWADIIGDGSGQAGLTLLGRPPVTGSLSGNTSVVGSWIETANSDMQSASTQYGGRIINNVTLAMPHAGIIAVASDKKNAVFQPHNLGSADQFSFRAPVPSPALNVLCANMDVHEISPLVYTKWPHAKTVEGYSIPGFKIPESAYWQNDIPRYSEHQFLNSTAVDDIFGWGSKYGRRPPVFETLPTDYNTIINTSMLWGDSGYILLKSNSTSEYTVCSMRAFLYPNCNTEYTRVGSFADLQSNCDGANGNFTYGNVVPDVPVTFSPDYSDVASLWAIATSLNDGVFAGNASNARMLTEFVPIEPSLNPQLPSVAEAIAALAGYTLLLSAIDSPFVHYWPYNETILNPGVYQQFEASVITAQYISRPNANWEYAFFFPLVWVLFVNIFCSLYLISLKGLVPDYTEVESLLALGVAAPQDDTLFDHCAHDHAEGPTHDIHGVRFWITRQGESGHSHFTGSNGRARRNNEEAHVDPGSGQDANPELDQGGENEGEAVDDGIALRPLTASSRRGTQSTFSSQVPKAAEEEFV